MNEAVSRRLGGLHSAEIIMSSYDFQRIADLQHTDNWTELAEVLCETARELQGAGADFLLIATNTMHKVVPQIEAATSLPILHIVDATAAAVKARGLDRVALLGTKFTMEDGFYVDRLTRIHGLEVVLPDATEREIIHEVLYRELGRGVISPHSREKYLGILERLAGEGAQGVILGCTEIPLLIKQEHVVMPVFDTTLIHAEAAVDYAIRT
jgi:aspartate racemase